MFKKSALGLNVADGTGYSGLTDEAEHITETTPALVSMTQVGQAQFSQA